MLAPDVRNLGRHPACGEEVGELQRRIRVRDDRLLGSVLGSQVAPERRDHLLDVAYPLERGPLHHRLRCAVQRSNLMRCRSGVQRGRRAFPQVEKGA